MIEAEMWREIPETDYSVSNLGRVASRKRGGWKALRPGRNSDGYQTVQLLFGGVSHSHTVHSLVALAFAGDKPSPKHEVNHKDGDRANNRADNLEWVTRSANQIHRYRVLGHGAPSGERSGKSKLDAAKVKEIRRRLSVGDTQLSIARDIGISKSAVMFINTGRTWAWLA